MSGTVQTRADRHWAPEEGWSVVAMVAILGLILATAIDEPAWVDGRGVLTDCLATCALLGALVGFAGPKLGWGRWRTHAIGALFAGLLLPIIAGWAVEPGATVVQAFRATADGTIEAYLDLAVRSLQFTNQEVHFVLVLGWIVWGTMQFGSYAVFGHRRPLSGVVMIGLVLLANMALTRRPQLGWLVLYSAVSLFLLIQMHAVGERATWVRRRIGDPGSISLLYLRGGTVFIVAAMMAALLLTSRATSSPLVGAWTGLNSRLVQIGEVVGRLFPGGGDIRGGSGVSFGSAARIQSQWYSDQGVAFTATVPAAAAGAYWRAAVYDQFVLGGWEQSSVQTGDVAANAPLLGNSPEIPAMDLFDQVQATVHPVGYHGTRALSPGLPSQVSLPSTLNLFGVQGWFAADDVSADTSYTVTALVPRLDGEAGITKNKLRAASTAYPKDVVDEYTQVPVGSMGPYAQQLLKTVLAKSPSQNPYDLASTIVELLQPPNFSYTTDIRGLDCTDRSQVECFAQFRKGYCLHYASTMAILLRAAIPDHPIPTRIVQGFLPSDVIGGTETVLNDKAHAWVEVYFPGYGWQMFDPTGGVVGRPPQLPEGAKVPTATATLGPPTLESPRTRPSRNADLPGTTSSGGSTPGQPSNGAVAAVIGILLAVTLIVLMAVAWWRGPRGEVSPEAAWSSVSRAASRFGFAPRPTQTVYEYAASLGELVPVARPDIVTVADAKVETTYAQVELSPEREHAVTLAMRRLRLSLVRLAFTRIKRLPRRR